MPGAVAEMGGASVQRALRVTGWKLRPWYSGIGTCAVALCVSAIFSAAAVAAEPTVSALPPLLSDATHIDTHWHVVGLPVRGKPVTQFAPGATDNVQALRVEANASYGNLVHDLPQPLLLRRVQWAWRVDAGNPLAELSSRTGDDVPLRLCFSFDLPLQRVPFVERQMLRLARAKLEQPLPTATLCYVWDDHLPHEALVENVFTRRVRMIVLRNAGDGYKRWFQESRDLAADFKRAFGDESADLLPVTAVAVGADGDNTGARTLAWLSDLRAWP